MKRNQNFDYNRSQKVLSCRYNMDINRVEARFEDPPLAVTGVWWIMKSIIRPKCYRCVAVIKMVTATFTQ